MIDGPKPTPDVREGFGRREATNVANELLGGLDPLLTNKKPQIIDFLLCELKFLAVEHNAPLGASLQEGAGGEEYFLNVLGPQDAVVYTLHVVGEITYDFIPPLGITISCT